MSRTARASVGGICYHVINRGNAGAGVFHKDDDYEAFVRLLQEGYERLAVPVLAYCLMPNHFPLVLWPRQDGDLSRCQPRYSHREVDFSPTVTLASVGSVGFSRAQIQRAMFSAVGFSSPSTSFRY